MISIKSFTGHVLILHCPFPHDLVGMYPQIRQAFDVPPHVPITLAPLVPTDDSYTHHEFLLLHPSPREVWEAVRDDLHHFLHHRHLARFADHSFPMFLAMYPEWEPSDISHLDPDSLAIALSSLDSHADNDVIFHAVHLFFSRVAPFLFCFDLR